MNLDRYSRQMLFSPLGGQGQRKLLSLKVSLLGCGALGSSMANLLVRAGIGRLCLIDRDTVELSNLQRQTLFDEEDVRKRRPKAIAARDRLAQINSEVEIDPQVVDVTPENIESLLLDTDIILDATDNFETRFLINDTSLNHSIPWVYGGCVRSEGAVMPVVPGRSACLRCLMPEPPEPGSTPTAETAGVLSPVVQTTAAFQVCEAIKILIGSWGDVIFQMRYFDLWKGTIQTIDTGLSRKRPDCPACALHRFDFLESEIT